MSPVRTRHCTSDDEAAFRDLTVSPWAVRTGRALSPEDDREIRQNLAGFFGVLLEWSREEARETDGDSARFAFDAGRTGPA